MVRSQIQNCTRAVARIAMTIGFVWAAQDSATAQLTIQLEPALAEQGVRVQIADHVFRGTLDADGKAVIQISEDIAPHYATLYEPRGVRSFYLVPGGPQELSRADFGRLRFEGAGKAINEYLQGVHSHLNFDYRMGEEEFIQSWKGAFESAQAYLESHSFPKAFEELERKRLYYVVCNALLIHPLHHSRTLNIPDYEPTDSYFETLQTVLIQDPPANVLWEYHQTFRDWLQALSAKNSEGAALDRFSYSLKYIADHIHDAALGEYLTHWLFTDYFRYNGTDGLAPFVGFFDERVKDSGLRAEFEQLFTEYARLEKGRIAPDFVFRDLNDESVSLSHFRGRYVYIDVWATWCIPCRREIPYLQMLERQFDAGDLAFVSISIDGDADKWKTFVQKEEMTGIQLHMGENSDFREVYKVTHVPRFMLIDPEGRIVEGVMTRPSDPRTAEVLGGLVAVSEGD